MPLSTAASDGRDAPSGVVMALFTVADDVPYAAPAIERMKQFIRKHTTG